MRQLQETREEVKETRNSVGQVQAAVEECQRIIRKVLGVVNLIGINIAQVNFFSSRFSGLT